MPDDDRLGGEPPFRGSEQFGRAQHAVKEMADSRPPTAGPAIPPIRKPPWKKPAARPRIPATTEVSNKLFYSERTVKNIIHDVTSRLELRNRAHAVAYAIREGLI